MRNLEIDKMETLSGGTNGALCFAAGLGIYALAGPAWIVGVASAAYAVKCWKS
ncbi:hypothetical protein CHRY9390_01968 [Chryseobacterium aquaeductus]|uniref:Bacteriocin n=1 Tax=Chryseobacterium aquaeductus TaxID=2675056 RepID=A0A9N8MGU3_9FLAO|nr:hypothetical protein CHRY9390_01968 [Chryseobacterium potabilaquae]CAD7809259.1 hypothetical protein CHRY9390_01968 [Chryseobacterium aquaeductus]